jgi:hypothetical protein
MRYRFDWKGKLRVDGKNNVHWNGQHVGKVSSRRVDGAKSPGGMVTDTVWTGTRLYATVGHGYEKDTASLTEAIEYILAGLGRQDS